MCIKINPFVPQKWLMLVPMSSQLLKRNKKRGVHGGNRKGGTLFSLPPHPFCFLLGGLMALGEIIINFGSETSTKKYYSECFFHFFCTGLLPSLYLLLPLLCRSPPIQYLPAVLNQKKEIERHKVGGNQNHEKTSCHVCLQHFVDDSWEGR
jgi:hypothetical protein